MVKITKSYLTYDVKITLHNKDKTETILTQDDLDEYTNEHLIHWQYELVDDNLKEEVA